jgi:streptogramin lyase
MMAVRRVFKTRAPALLIAALFLLVASPAAWGITKTYTLDAEFDEGTLLNVNHDAPNNDQLQLNSVTTPFPFVNIACSARGTIVRIDVNTGAILGEYQTAPDGMGMDPSRTTVDKFGNVWVSNRAEAGMSGGLPKGSLSRVALVIGGTRCDADGTPNPLGQYLKPPFFYNTAQDRDGDGLIKTSRGLGNILAWTNAGLADKDGGVSTAEDECIINYTRVVGTNTRTVAIDANNDVWVGGLGNEAHEKLSGVTGLPIPGTQFDLNCGGYGGLIDGNGVLWSARGGTGLLRYDTNTLSGVCNPGGYCGDYGLGIDPATGNIWQTGLSNGRVYVNSPAGACIASWPHGNAYAQGVAVDGSGNVWVAHSILGPQTTVGHLRTDGTFIGVIGLPGGSGPTGVAVDANGKIWVANLYTNNAMRIDPNAGPIVAGFHVGAVDLVVDLGPGSNPYNYSDMTGFVSIGATSPSGTWTVVFNGGQAGIPWTDASWNSSEPPGTGVVVEVRAANNQVDLPLQPFLAVSNGGPIAGVTGRYIEVRTSLSRTAQGNVSPILYDLTVNGITNHDPNCDGATPSVTELWPPDHEYVPVSVLGVTDQDGDPITFTWDVTQDEPINATGDGNTCPDARVVNGQLELRAERSGNAHHPGNGRVYHVAYVAHDGQGGSCSGSFNVCVPHDQRKGHVCVDDGLAVNSMGSCSAPSPIENPVNDGITGEVTAVRLEPVELDGNTAVIRYGVPSELEVNLQVFDIAGRIVATLERSTVGAGMHERRMDTGGLSRGIYFARLRAGSVIATRTVYIK